MGEWPDRLSVAETQVLRASVIVPDGAKLVFTEHWYLDVKGLGCWLTHDQVGARLGMSGRSIETYRMRLADGGLLVALKERGVRSYGWRATLPDQCRIRSQRPAPDVIARHRQYLDRHLVKWPPEPRTSEERTPQGCGARPAGVRSLSEILSPAGEVQDVDSLAFTSPVVRKGKREEVKTALNAEEEKAPDQIENEGWERIRKLKSRPKLMTAAEREVYQRWLAKQPENVRRMVLGL